MKKIWIMCIALIIMLTGCGKGDSMNDAENQPEFQQVSMQEGLDLMKEDSDYILLDVRRADEFEEGHIPGAINIPNESIGAEEIEELPEYSCAVTPQIRQMGNRLSGLAETAYASLLA